MERIIERTLIEQIWPEATRVTRSLRSRLIWEASHNDVTHEEVDAILSSTPFHLLNSRCFRDPLTNLWRYEFGRPFTLKRTEKLLWGTHMWMPVSSLLAVLRCAFRRLPPAERSLYLQRLANPDSHRDAAAEMAPLLRVDPIVSAEFEVVGAGVENRTIDWRIGPIDGRSVLIDVKNRVVDLLRQMDRSDVTLCKAVPAPTHDPKLLFRDVETKLLTADPASCLQGAWVHTELKQEVSELEGAFRDLDATKVHFAILGDFEEDVHLLTRHADQKQFLKDLFGVAESARFVFTRHSAHP